MMIFCFKQKTAYEMRISDWSSDVCSSDLELDRDGITVTIQRWTEGRIASGDSETYHRSGDQWRRASGAKVDPAEEAADRQSAVKGKSVSVGVDLGCRRKIKPKQQIT